MESSVNLYECEEDTWNDRGDHDVVGDDEYDALNEETFGSAAEDGDWEQSHHEFSHITQSERNQGILNDISLPQNPKEKNGSSLFSDGLPTSFDALRLEEKAHPNKSYSQSPVNLPSLSLNEYPSGSPVESIWSSLFKKVDPTSLIPKTSDNHITTQQQQNYGKTNVSSLGPAPKIPSMKTVTELEQEMKWQHGAQHIQNAMKLEQLEHNLALNREAQPRIINPGVGEHGGMIRQYHRQPITMNPLSMTAPTPFSNVPNQLRHQLPLMERHHGRPYINNMVHSTLLHDLKSSGRQNPNNNMHGYNPVFNMTMPPPMGHRKFHYGNLDHRMRQNSNDGFSRSRSYFDQFKSNSESSMNGFVKEYTNSGNNRTRRDSDSEWEEWLLLREKDEFAGLMTPREKNWLKNIQSMQLQSDNPYQDDYYYVMYSAHKQKRLGQDIIEINGLQLLADKSKDGKEYEPPQLENSLGKLQVVSVNAPRKIIDFDLSQSSPGGSSSPTSKLIQNDMRKRRHLLLHIEKLWDVHIELADLERKIRALPDCPTRDLYRVKCSQLVQKLWSGLTASQESFIQILCIKKGKSLCSHLLRWLSENEVEYLVAAIIQNISSVYKRDLQDGQLDSLWLGFDRLLATSTTSRLKTFAVMASSQLRQNHKNMSIPLLDCKLTFSSMLTMLVRGEELWAELEKECIWQEFLGSLVAALLQLSEKHAKGDPSNSPEEYSVHHRTLPSVSLAASPRNITSQILRCRSADSKDLLQAAEYLRPLEVILKKKNTPL